MKNISLILTAICFISTTAFVNAQTKEAKITFSEESFDFGNIAEEKGPVTKEFTFTNTGAAPVIVQNVKASCGCTTPDWTKDPVLPGKKGVVKATYNPQNRPGQFNKTITVTSNAENNTVILTIKGVVSAKPRTLEDDYPMQMGGLRLKSNHIAFIKVFTTEIKTDSLQIINTSSEDIKMTFEKIPNHIKIKAVPETIKPNAKGVIIATYDGSKQADWGFIMDRIDLMLNGKFDANNRISVSATIDEDYTKLIPEQRANAPKVNFESKDFNFGTIKEGDLANFDYKLTNDGKTDLLIRKVKASCGCTAVTPSETIIKPGQSTTIKSTFNSTGKPGKQNKTITVITNDPDNSNVTLRITGDVEKVEQTTPLNNLEQAPQPNK